MRILPSELSVTQTYGYRDHFCNRNRSSRRVQKGGMMSAVVLVTGASGYIGSILVPMLLRDGYRVIALDNLMYNQNTLLDCISTYPDRFNFVRGDTRNIKLIDHIFKEYRPEYIIPLAAIVGAPACAENPETSTTVNIGGVMEVTQRYLGNFTPMVIYPNTNSGYGIGQEGIFCTEESPLNPISLYGRQKVEAEKYVLERKNSIVLRLATVFGISPRMRLDLLVNDFVYRAVNDRFTVLFEPHFKRNYIHVKDVARAFIHCMRNFDRMKNQVYNLGLSDANLSKWELCEEIKKKIPNFYFSNY
jgi:nucleoside-diphosphate-sugar epimerase